MEVNGIRYPDVIRGSDGFWYDGRRVEPRKRWIVVPEALETSTILLYINPPFVQVVTSDHPFVLLPNGTIQIAGVCINEDDEQSILILDYEDILKPFNILEISALTGIVPEVLTTFHNHDHEEMFCLN